jgi:Ca2+/Na+ antiporter
MEKPEINFNAADAAFALAMLVCGFLYWNLIRLYALGAGVTIFTIVLCAASCVYLFKSGVKQKKRSLICLFVVALSAAQFSLFDNQFIAFLNFIFLTLAFIYWICLSTNRNIDKKLSAYIIGDAFTQIIRIPFMNFGCFFGGMKKGFSKQKKGKGILAALIGILIFMPLLAAVMS